MTSRTFDIAVIGGGLAGLTAALALSRSGHAVALLAPPAGKADGRTTALMLPAIELLTRLGVWQAVAEQSAPLRTMRLIDGSDRLIRSPTVSFHASEIGEAAFGYNIPNAALTRALHSAVAANGAITLFEQSADTIDVQASPTRLDLADGQSITASMIVAADGRRSLAREAVGIKARTWSYPQSAIVLTFAHSVPHEATSNEFHLESGPFTQVPLPGDRSSLVWVLAPDAANRMEMLDRPALNRAIEAQMHSMLGAIEVDSPLQQFPLSGMAASAFGRGPVVLVGEAGHVFPPIGAQGLNLGMRDVIALLDIRLDLGSPDGVRRTVESYDRARRSDIRTRTTAVDILNRSLLTHFLPVHLARATGLSLLSSSNPLRGFAIREGMRPGSGLRDLARSVRGKSGERHRSSR
ncbi:UbiH/UbiF family hydroxylase [Pararhizobium haloflavum]|uniref:UbiH/UbiF family hydroxylase n=1 Tax=Pararhizobium haloflavum TaxID=2037914 RepID=UPI000C179AA9|nr:UbiH/UbiF family hydroxylase [Pararhizobium haloflavum]